MRGNGTMHASQHPGSATLFNTFASRNGSIPECPQCRCSGYGRHRSYSPPLLNITILKLATDISTLSAAQVYDLNQVRLFFFKAKITVTLDPIQRVLDSISDVHRPLIAARSGIEDLRAEYERGSPSFVRQIDWLKDQGYIAIRRTRGRS